MNEATKILTLHNMLNSATAGTNVLLQQRAVEVMYPDMDERESEIVLMGLMQIDSTIQEWQKMQDLLRSHKRGLPN